jgi:hypothetical protein
MDDFPRIMHLHLEVRIGDSGQLDFGDQWQYRYHKINNPWKDIDSRIVPYVPLYDPIIQ